MSNRRRRLPARDGNRAANAPQKDTWNDDWPQVIRGRSCLGSSSSSSSGFKATPSSHCHRLEANVGRDSGELLPVGPKRHPLAHWTLGPSSAWTKLGPRQCEPVSVPSNSDNNHNRHQSNSSNTRQKTSNRATTTSNRFLKTIKLFLAALFLVLSAVSTQNPLRFHQVACGSVSESAARAGNRQQEATNRPGSSGSQTLAGHNSDGDPLMQLASQMVGQTPFYSAPEAELVAGNAAAAEDDDASVLFPVMLASESSSASQPAGRVNQTNQRPQREQSWRQPMTMNLIKGELRLELPLEAPLAGKLDGSSAAGSGPARQQEAGREQSIDTKHRFVFTVNGKELALEPPSPPPGSKDESGQQASNNNNNRSELVTATRKVNRLGDFDLQSSAASTPLSTNTNTNTNYRDYDADTGFEVNQHDLGPAASLSSSSMDSASAASNDVVGQPMMTPSKQQLSAAAAASQTDRRAPPSSSSSLMLPTLGHYNGLDSEPSMAAATQVGVGHPSAGPTPSAPLNLDDNEWSSGSNLSAGDLDSASSAKTSSQWNSKGAAGARPQATRDSNNDSGNKIISDWPRATAAGQQQQQQQVATTKSAAGARSGPAVGAGKFSTLLSLTTAANNKLGVEQSDNDQTKGTTTTTTTTTTSRRQQQQEQTGTTGAPPPKPARLRLVGTKTGGGGTKGGHQQQINRANVTLSSVGRPRAPVFAKSRSFSSSIVANLIGANSSSNNNKTTNATTLAQSHKDTQLASGPPRHTTGANANANALVQADPLALSPPSGHRGARSSARSNGQQQQQPKESPAERLPASKVELISSEFIKANSIREYKTNSMQLMGGGGGGGEANENENEANLLTADELAKIVDQDNQSIGTANRINGNHSANYNRLQRGHKRDSGRLISGANRDISEPNPVRPQRLLQRDIPAPHRLPPQRPPLHYDLNHHHQHHLNHHTAPPVHSFIHDHNNLVDLHSLASLSQPFVSRPVGFTVGPAGASALATGQQQQPARRPQGAEVGYLINHMTLDGDPVASNSSQPSNQSHAVDHTAGKFPSVEVSRSSQAMNPSQPSEQQQQQLVTSTVRSGNIVPYPFAANGLGGAAPTLPSLTSPTNHQHQQQQQHLRALMPAAMALLAQASQQHFLAGYPASKHSRAAVNQLRALLGASGVGPAPSPSAGGLHQLQNLISPPPPPSAPMDETTASAAAAAAATTVQQVASAAPSPFRGQLRANQSDQMLATANQLGVAHLGPLSASESNSYQSIVNLNGQEYHDYRPMGGASESLGPTGANESGSMMVDGNNYHQQRQSQQMLNQADSQDPQRLNSASPSSSSSSPGSASNNDHYSQQQQQQQQTSNQQDQAPSGYYDGPRAQLGGSLMGQLMDQMSNSRSSMADHVYGLKPEHKSSSSSSGDSRQQLDPFEDYGLPVSSSSSSSAGGGGGLTTSEYERDLADLDEEFNRHAGFARRPPMMAPSGGGSGDSQPGGAMDGPPLVAPERYEASVARFTRRPPPASYLDYAPIDYQQWMARPSGSSSSPSSGRGAQSSNWPSMASASLSSSSAAGLYAAGDSAAEMWLEPTALDYSPLASLLSPTAYGSPAYARWRPRYYYQQQQQQQQSATGGPHIARLSPYTTSSGGGSGGGGGGYLAASASADQPAYNFLSYAGGPAAGAAAAAAGLPTETVSFTLSPLAAAAAAAATALAAAEKSRHNPQHQHHWTLTLPRLASTLTSAVGVGPPPAPTSASSSNSVAAASSSPHVSTSLPAAAYTIHHRPPATATTAAGLGPSYLFGSIPIYLAARSPAASGPLAGSASGVAPSILPYFHPMVGAAPAQAAGGLSPAIIAYRPAGAAAAMLPAGPLLTAASFAAYPFRLPLLAATPAASSYLAGPSHHPTHQHHHHHHPYPTRIYPASSAVQPSRSATTGVSSSLASSSSSTSGGSPGGTQLRPTIYSSDLQFAESKPKLNGGASSDSPSASSSASSGTKGLAKGATSLTAIARNLTKKMFGSASQMRPQHVAPPATFDVLHHQTLSLPLAGGLARNL